MKEERTLGPWFVTGMNDSVVSVLGTDGIPTMIAQCANRRGETQANAAFIVRACNAHDDLVATAKVALEQYRLYLYVNGLPEDGRAFDALDAAITKATA